MADGHTALAQARFDFEGADLGNGSLDVELQMAAGGLIGERLYYHLDAPADWREQAEAGLARAAQNAPGTGRMEAYAYDYADWDALLDAIAGQEPVVTAPEVPYPVNGSSEYVEFVAANLIAGNHYLDITAYAEAGIGTPSFSSVVNEAVTQNPYVLTYGAIGKMWREGERTFGYVHFRDFGLSQAEVAADQEEIRQVVDQAMAEVISEGMSDREKALALNLWLIGHAAYDYEAYEEMLAIKASPDPESQDAFWKEYPHNQDAHDVLVRRIGVCASYAQGYKALADAAGLEAIVVVGEVLELGSRHAWNKVFMDGKWQNVDTTWNDDPQDSGRSATKYFGVTDDSLGRVEDFGWMVGWEFSRYEAV
jgi:transglutaminase-like putative cysteine protease